MDGGTKKKKIEGEGSRGGEVLAIQMGAGFVEQGNEK